MKKRKVILVLSTVAVAALIAGSLAYWNQTHTIENPFDTSERYGSTVIEDFTPENGENWQPGVEVDKSTQVQNTGDQDIIVRVKMDEKWVRKDENSPYKVVPAETEGAVYVTSQESATDGLTAADGSVVIKNFVADTDWIDGGDGWFYYQVNLEAGKTTDKWLRSVELLNDVDMGVQEILYYVTTDTDVNESTTWEQYDPADGMPKVLDEKPVLHNKTEVVYKTDSADKELIGYLNSNYTLTITTQTVQATKEAVIATFGLTEMQVAALNTNWKFADE